MKNGDTLIGLFQGMFEGNILTCNPSWDTNASALDEFDDVRDIQQQLQANGIALQKEAYTTTQMARQHRLNRPRWQFDFDRSACLKSNS